ncbi:hypothetical protein V6N13_136712 [Hibiscus sabdariffa]|uniref:Uncharacterized protein n=1 Tax=Hibiscus sabdariffa TaxID=183260 RepID=A0ABR2DQR4_9ROSI
MGSLVASHEGLSLAEKGDGGRAMGGLVVEAREKDVVDDDDGDEPNDDFEDEIVDDCAFDDENQKIKF